MGKHTPGPWMIEGCGMVLNPASKGIIDTIRIACPVGKIEIIDETNEAPLYNAQLIAAAPDLLAALEYIVMHLEHRPGLAGRKDLWTDDEMDHLKSAIRKARGEE